MKGWFIGEDKYGRSAEVRLTSVVGLFVGAYAVDVHTTGPVVYEFNGSDRERFLQEFRDFHAGPAVEPEKAAVIDPRKIGRLNRMPTVEEVEAVDVMAGSNWAEWTWTPGTTMDRPRRVMLAVERKGFDSPTVVWRYYHGQEWERLAAHWRDGDSMEPITEAP